MAINIMGLTVPQLRRWGPNQPLDHRQLNEPVDVLNDMTRGVGVPRQVRVRGGAAAAVGSAVAHFKLRQSGHEFGDYLRCRTWDWRSETEGDEDVFVARPWLLRRSSFEDITRAGIHYTYSTNSTRTARRTSDNATEVQIIIPMYYIGDILKAEKGIVGDTGVVVEDVMLEWEARTEGRAWARKRRQ